MDARQQLATLSQLQSRQRICPERIGSCYSMSTPLQSKPAAMAVRCVHNGWSYRNNRSHAASVVSFSATGKVHSRFLPRQRHILRLSLYVARAALISRPNDLGSLDQYRAHPIKSRETRLVRRSLRLRYVSLPKRSPDDKSGRNHFQRHLSCDP